MTEITRVAATTVQAYAARGTGANPKQAQTQAPANDPAGTRVDLVHSQTSYTASLDTLRKANKMMMGYLLNIKA